MTDGIRRNLISEKDDLCFTQLNYAGDYTAMSETVAKGMMLSPIENCLVTNMWPILCFCMIQKINPCPNVKAWFEKSKHFIARSRFAFFFLNICVYVWLCGSKVWSGPGSGFQEMRMCLKHFELHDSSVWDWLFPHRQEESEGLQSWRAVEQLTYIFNWAVSKTKKESLNTRFWWKTTSSILYLIFYCKLANSGLFFFQKKKWEDFEKL